MRHHHRSDSREILLFGSNDSAGLEICRSLGQAGHHVAILRLSLQRTAADHSRFCEESLFIGSPHLGVGEYAAKLNELLCARSFDYLIPVDDLPGAITHFDYDAIASRTRIVGPSPASYAVARHHFRSLKLAEAAGLARPETALIKQGGEGLGVQPAPLFPCLVMPVLSSLVLEDEPQTLTARTVNSAEELDSKLRDDLPRVDVMLQAPVSGTDIGLSFCAIDGDVLGASVITYVHVLRRGGGSSYRSAGEVTPQTLKIVKSIARQLCWTGFMTIECRKCRGRLFLMELKCWPSSSMTPSVLSGVDLPRLLVAGLEGRRGPSIALSTRSVYARHLRADMGWFFTRGKSGSGLKALEPWIGAFGRLLSGREGFDVERIGDPLPAIRQFDGPAMALGARIALRMATAVRGVRTSQPQSGSLSKKCSVLVVCQGNINRSVVAEHLLRAHGFSSVRSAGLLGMSGRRPSKQAEEFLLKRVGIDASQVRSRSIPRALKQMGAPEVVVCFERKHIVDIALRYPSLRGRIVLLSRLANDRESEVDIVDPHGLPEEGYLACFRQIEKFISQLAVRDDSPRPLYGIPADHARQHTGEQDSGGRRWKRDRRGMR